MAPPTARQKSGGPAAPAFLPDHILEDIFLRLESGYDLARASATCQSFRRVATGRRFLRHFLSLHPPPIVGFIDFNNRRFYRADPPHRSARAARALARAGDFTFFFLPHDSSPNNFGRVCDVRDGSLLPGGSHPKSSLRIRDGPVLPFVSHPKSSLRIRDGPVLPFVSHPKSSLSIRDAHDGRFLPTVSHPKSSLGTRDGRFLPGSHPKSSLRTHDAREGRFLPLVSHPKSSCHFKISWRICDARDGRFPFSRDPTNGSTFLELVVCDPLYRRYFQIPHIPGDLVPHTPSNGEMRSEPFLAPAGDEVEVQHFRVIYNWLSNDNITSFTFSAATGKWCLATSFSFLPDRLIHDVKKLERYYARSCFYWVHPSEQYMLVLDACEMKFSLVLHGKGRLMGRTVEGLAITDAAEGRIGLLTLDGYRLDLYSKTCQSNGVEAEDWRHDECIPLPEPDGNHFIIGAAEGFLLLGISQHVHQVRSGMQCFVLNLKTLLVEKLCELDGRIRHVHPYASFPPPLSLPSI